MIFFWKPSSQFFGAYQAIFILTVYLIWTKAGNILVSFGKGFLQGFLSSIWPTIFDPTIFEYISNISTTVLIQIGKGIILILCVDYFSRAMFRDFWGMIGWSSFRINQVLWGFLGGGLLSLMIILTRLSYSAPIALQPNTYPMILPKETIFLALMALSSLLLAPLIEEVFYRGVLYLGFCNSWGPAWAAVGVTLIWSTIHALNSQDIILKLLTTLLVGAILLMVRIKTHSLFPSIALHFSYNFVWMTFGFFYLDILPS